MNQLSNLLGRYVGAFALGALAVIGPVCLAGRLPDHAVLSAALCAGIVAVWKLSLTPPASPTRLIADITQEKPHE